MPTFDLPNADSPWWLPQTLLLFCVLILGIKYLLSHLSGWRSLASRFACKGAVEGEHFRFASAAMGYLPFPVSYNRTLCVTVAPTGFRLSKVSLFRLFSPPLFIPRSEIESVNEARFLFLRSTVIRVRGHWGGIRLYGRVGEKIFLAYGRTSPR